MADDSENSPVVLGYIIDKYMDRREIDQRFLMVDDKVKTAFEANSKLTDSRFNAAQEAIHKAEVATEKRFEGVNEFRKTLSDQTVTFATKEAMESWSRESRIAQDTLAKEIQKSTDVGSQSLAEHADRDNAMHADLSDRLGATNARLSNIEGRFWMLGFGVSVLNLLVAFGLHSLH